MNKIMRFLLVLAAMSVCATARAVSTTYYGKVTASASPSGSGKVYVATSATEVPASGDYKATHSVDKKSAETTATSADVEFYVYAQPTDGYRFANWEASAGGSLDAADAPSGCKVTVKASGSSTSPTAVTVTAKFEPLPRVPVPTAATGLVYDGTAKTGVAAGTGYTLTGHTATAAGDYTATATLAEGYRWADGSGDPQPVKWSIAPRPIRVIVLPACKYRGEEDPEFAWEIAGTEEFPLAEGGVLPSGEKVELKGTLVRTAGETVADSPYDIDTLTTLNEANNPNYVFEAQLDGEDRFTILPRPGLTLEIVQTDVFKLLPTSIRNR